MEPATATEVSTLSCQLQPSPGPKSGQKHTANTLGRVPLPVDEVKALGKRFDKSITVNDVLSALLAGRFRSVFGICLRWWRSTLGLGTQGTVTNSQPLPLPLPSGSIPV